MLAPVAGAPMPALSSAPAAPAPGAGSIASVLAPTHSHNFKGLSIDTTAAAAAPAVLSPTSAAVPLSSRDDARLVDTRPSKRRRAAGTAAAVHHHHQVPLTPTTPTSTLCAPEAASASSSARAYASALAQPPTPLTPVSPMDTMHSAFQPLPSSAAAQTAPPRCPRRPSVPALHINPTLTSIIDIAHRQYVAPEAASGIYLVAEHRGLVPAHAVSPTLTHQQTRAAAAAANAAGIRTVAMSESAVLVYPTQTLDQLFRAETRYAYSEHFLFHHTNMGGGVQVSIARRATINWLMSINESHQLFRYKVNTLCVAVQYMDRYLASLAGGSSGSTSAQPAADTPRPARPAPLSQWRTYDWHLLAMVCLSLAAKMVEEYDDPTMREMAGFDFNPEHVRLMQLAVVKALNFNMGAASPIQYIHEFLAQPNIRSLAAELLPLVPAAVAEAQQQQQQQQQLQQHGVLYDETGVPLTPPSSAYGSPSPQLPMPIAALEPEASPVVPLAPQSGALEQWAGMLVPELLEPLLAIAEQYVQSLLSAPESALYRPSELAVAALNLALEVRSLQLNATTRIDPVTGQRRVVYASKSVALGFYGHAMTARANACRELLLRVLPRETFFITPEQRRQQLAAQQHAQQQQQQQQQMATAPLAAAAN